jgi:hypothetical protein
MYVAHLIVGHPCTQLVHLLAQSRNIRLLLAAYAPCQETPTTRRKETYEDDVKIHPLNVMSEANLGDIDTKLLLLLRIHTQLFEFFRGGINT